MAGTIEDTRDAVRLGQQRRVRHGKADADAETLNAADDRARFGENDKRLEITDNETREQHEAKLSTGSLDNWRVKVLQESGYDHTRRGNAHDRQRRRHDGERTVPAHVLLDQSETAAPVVGRPPAARARAATVLIDDEGVRITGCAHPAAGVALLDTLDVSDIARPTALGHRNVVRTYQQNQQPDELKPNN